MPDYRTFFDRNYLYAYDLKGRDVTVTIKAVKAAKVRNETKEQRKPILFFRESHDERGLVLCVTNGKTIAGMYGNDTDRWVGKRITLFPTTTHFGKEEVDCIRVRPKAPGASQAAGEFAEPESMPAPTAPEHAGAREPGEDG